MDRRKTQQGLGAGLLLVTLTLAGLGAGALLLQRPVTLRPALDEARAIGVGTVSDTPQVALAPLDAPQPIAEASPSLAAPSRRASTAAAVRPGREAPLPTLADGGIDFAALGMTGKESGAELLRTEERRPAVLEYSFRPGDAWEVETYYRQMQTGRGDSWSNPVIWRFEVLERVRFQGQVALSVRATLFEESGVQAGLSPATLYVDPDDYRLVGADVSEIRAGEEKHARLNYAPGGATRAGGSLVPFDLPPRGVEGRLTSGNALPTLDPVDAASRGLFPAPGVLVGAGGDYLEVEFESPTDGTTVRQRWSVGDLRWPTETITEHWRSYRRKLS